MIGQALAHYRITEKLGAGGMGEVYRATDTKLGRDVAIKVLPAALAHEPERLARFEREARVLASLNHPNIAAIYGFEEANGVRFLVLEYVPGPTLAEQVAAGRLPFDETMQICINIAQALEVAHEKGIVHRDLKPANVKVTPEGKVKVLDFGLAKAFADEAAAGDPTHSPTLSVAATRAGTILGTAAYMSPEQARGRPLDKRTDVWAFGCVLYELLTGTQAFRGESVQDVLAAVLRAEPDWSALPPDTSPKIRELLQRCLQKDPTRRLRDIGDAGLEMVSLPASAPPIAKPRSVGWQRWMLPSAAALLAVAAAVLGVALWRAISVPLLVTRSVITLPANDRLAIRLQPSLAISPDGAKLVYVALRGGRAQLFLRRIDQFDAAPISGTEDAIGPFFSPDGEWVGFFAGGKLKKVLVSGGATLALCDAPSGAGATWAPDDTIIFNPTSGSGSGLQRVSANGGPLQELTKPDPKKQELAHRWPQILPGGTAVLFTVRIQIGLDDNRLEVLSLDTGKRKSVLTGGSFGRYVPGGHIVFARTGGLFAAPFDLGRLEITGRQFPVIEGVMTGVSGEAQFGFSDSGSLAYVPGGFRAASRSLVWVDRKGTVSSISPLRRTLFSPRLSPDGKLVAISSSDGGNTDVWILDLARDTPTRLTFDPGYDAVPVWTPDGKRVAYRCAKGLCAKPADGSGAEEQLTTATNFQYPRSWSPDGKWLIFEEQHPANGSDIWVLPAEGERKPRPFLQTQFSEWGARLSPDGRWLAYASNESGPFQVYVQPFPGPGGKWMVSSEGGVEPAWSRNGKELFYRNGDKVMAVDVTPGGRSFAARRPRQLFGGPYFAFPGFVNMDVSPDGQRFLMIREGGSEDNPVQLNLVTNWFEELKGRK